MPELDTKNSREHSMELGLTQYLFFSFKESFTPFDMGTCDD